MKNVFKVRKRQPFEDKTSRLNVVPQPQCQKLSVKLVALDAKTMNTRNKKNAVDKVSEVNRDEKLSRRDRKVAVVAFKGKTKPSSAEKQCEVKDNDSKLLLSRGNLQPQLPGKTVMIDLIPFDNKTSSQNKVGSKVTAVNAGQTRGRGNKASDIEVNKQCAAKLVPQEKELKIVVPKLKASDSEVKSNQVAVDNKQYAPKLPIQKKTILNNENQNLNLRRRAPKDYMEPDSTINNSEIDSPKQTYNELVPIYKRQLQKEQAKPTTDLYEFTDVSPKQKKITDPRRSSKLFDKDTYEILQKIEQKEAKAKKRVLAVRKKKPTYEDIMTKIISNVTQKIVNKNTEKLQKETQQPENCRDVNNSPIQDISQKKSNDNTVSDSNEKLQEDNDNGATDDLNNSFGFEEEEMPASTPVKPPTITILSDIQLSKGVNINNESTFDLSLKRPNANSTMLNPNHSCSPWRLNWVNMRHNPHFVSVKPNALPRIDQEPVIEHSLVKSFESGCHQTPKKAWESTPKKHKVQQSILDYIDSNIEKENVVPQGSLYDYEAFNSPVKSAKKKRVVKNLCPDENGDTSSSVLRSKRWLTDITNNTIESVEQDVSYFGFDRSGEVKSPAKTQEALPTRLDVSQVKKYLRRNKKVTFPKPVAYEVKAAEDDFSLDIPIDQSVDGSNEEVHLFEEPEEILANMSPPHESKSKRKRLNSTDSDISPQEKKRKKHKKTKTELEQEEWIKEFNKMCDEVEEYELEIE